MKRFLFKLLLYLFIIIGLDICFGILGDYLQDHAKRGVTKRTNDIVMNDVHDIVILGSSRAHHHYDTPYLSDTLGLDIYNAGYDGNGVVLAEGLVELIMERYQPKLIIYDVEPAFDVIEYPNDNHHIRYINNLKPYYRHQAIGRIIKDVSKEEWYKVHSGMFRYNSKLVTLLMENVRTISTDPYGFSPLKGEYSGDIPQSNYESRCIDKFKLTYIERLINTSQSHHIPIILVASPKLGYEDILDLQPVKDICAKNKVDFLDYYASQEFQNRLLYKDPMHLNNNGARVFSSKIAVHIGKILYN